MLNASQHSGITHTRAFYHLSLSRADRDRVARCFHPVKYIFSNPKIQSHKGQRSDQHPLEKTKRRVRRTQPQRRTPAAAWR